MRLALSSVAAACLLTVGTAVGASTSGIQADNTCAGDRAGQVFVQDGFLDDQTRGALLTGLSVKRIDDGHYKHLYVPASLSERVMAALGRFVPGGRGHAAVTKDTVLLPFTEHVGDAPEHQDHHRDGMRQGHMAQGHVGVVYLEGDGDFVFTNTVTGDEERVAIVPGKMISWPNKGFRHRVERGSMPRHLLGPMVLDATSGSLLGVGAPFTECQDTVGYQCVDPAPEKISTAAPVATCIDYCGLDEPQFRKDLSYDTDTNKCNCYASQCNAFKAETGASWYVGDGETSPTGPLNIVTDSPSTAPSSSPSASPSKAPSNPSTSPTNAPSSAPRDPISISAASLQGRSSVRGGKYCTLLATLSLPAADTLGRRELFTKTSTDKHALNSTIYALLVEALDADDITYKHTSVHPRLQPASLKKPALQAGGDLLWSNVAMRLYASKPFKRTFKVTFKVSADATSPLTFVASVWKDDVQLQTATPVVVTVTSKSG